MKLKYDPFPLIFTQGDDATKLMCLEFMGLVETPGAKTYLLSLIKQQHLCGTFPSYLEPRQWGLRETARYTLLFLRVGMPPECLNVQSSIHFILNVQRPDGGWSENPLLKIPPEQTWLSNRRSITWLTADIIELLNLAGLSKRFEYLAAVDFLRGLQNQDGSWPSVAPNDDTNQSHIGDPDPTAQITFLMGEICGYDDPVYQMGKSRFESYLAACAHDVERGYLIRGCDGKKQQNDVYQLTHLLLSWILDPPRRFSHGYAVRDPRVKRMMEALIAIQAQDGGWRPFWAEESSAIYTVLAIKVLVLSGMLTRKNLNPGVNFDITCIG